MFEVEKFPGLSARRRWLIALLAVATAVAVVLMMTHLHRGKRPPPEPARCAPGQTRDCLGGQADVFAVPPTAGDGAQASAPR